MLAVFKFFQTEDYKMSRFKDDWQTLSNKDKVDLRSGIENGTFTY